MKVCACLLALCVAFAAPLAHADTPIRNYDGPDGGWIVFSTTTLMSGYGGDVLVHMHKVGGHGQWGDPLSKKPDATAPSFGSRAVALAQRRGLPIDGPNGTQIYVFRQPPGAYEIYNFQVTSGGYPALVFQRFSGPIAITVSAGATTYVGAFTFVPVRQMGSFLTKLATGAAPFGWALLASDRSDRDLAIARSDVPDLGPVTPSVPPLNAAH